MLSFIKRAFAPTLASKRTSMRPLNTNFSIELFKGRVSVPNSQADQSFQVKYFTAVGTLVLYSDSHSVHVGYAEILAQKARIDARYEATSY